VRRHVVWLLLSGYLFSITAASYFHDHGKAGWFGPAVCRLACDVSLQAGESLCGGADCASQAAAGRGCVEHSTEDCCAVCRFLAQKVAAEPPIEPAHSAPLCDRAISAGRSYPIRAAVSLHYSRAPPSVV